MSSMDPDQRGLTSMGCGTPPWTTKSTPLTPTNPKPSARAAATSPAALINASSSDPGRAGRPVAAPPQITAGRHGRARAPGPDVVAAAGPERLDQPASGRGKGVGSLFRLADNRKRLPTPFPRFGAEPE